MWEARPGLCARSLRIWQNEQPLNSMSGAVVQLDTTFHHDAPAGRWRALGILATAGFLEMSTWFSASVVLPQLRAAWGITASVGAWLTISVMIGFVAGADRKSVV